MKCIIYIELFFQNHHAEFYDRVYNRWGWWPHLSWCLITTVYPYYYLLYLYYTIYWFLPKNLTRSRKIHMLIFENFLMQDFNERSFQEISHFLYQIVNIFISRILKFSFQDLEKELFIFLNIEFVKIFYKIFKRVLRLSY